MQKWFWEVKIVKTPNTFLAKPEHIKQNPNSMANSLIIKTLNSIKRNPKFFTKFSSQSQIQTHLFTSIANAQEPNRRCPSSSTFTFSSDGKTHKNDNNNSIYVKALSSNSQMMSSLSSVTMSMSFDWFDSDDDDADADVV